MKPRLLDLFCGAGGAAMGYARAGFEVVGVDNRAQPRYPFAFVQADALEFLTAARLSSIAAIHASPPCQAYSSTRHLPGARGGPDLVDETRAALGTTGLPWIMENVPGSPLAAHIVLCGTMFGLTDGAWELRRHRLFETSGLFVLTPQCQHNGPVIGVYGGKARDRRRTLSVAGNFPARETRRALGVYGNGGGPKRAPRGPKASIAEARRLMGIDWMTTAEICQAIPPAYTEYIGRQLLAALEAAA